MDVTSCSQTASASESLCHSSSYLLDLLFLDLSTKYYMSFYCAPSSNILITSCNLSPPTVPSQPLV